MLESFNRNEKLRQKEVIATNEFLAKRIIEYLSGSLNKGSKIEKLWNYYPDLFDEEKKVIEVKDAEVQAKIFKERFRAFANRHNSKM